MTLKRALSVTVSTCALLFFSLLAPTEGYAQYSTENMIVAPQLPQVIEEGTPEITHAQEVPAVKIHVKNHDNKRIPYRATNRNHLPSPNNKFIDTNHSHETNNSIGKLTVVKPLHVHNYKETVVDATCSSDGYTLHKCVCGASYTNNETEALGHKYNSETISPTTNSNGYDLHTCSRCSNQYKDNYTDPLSDYAEPEDAQSNESIEPGEMNHNHGNGDSNFQGTIGTLETEDNGYCPKCSRRNWTSWCPIGCIKFSRDTVCECGVLVHAGECHNHDTGGGYTGGGGTPETEDYGFCSQCDRRFLTSWYPEGCFTYLVDTVCECGVLVHAMECHHH